MNLSAFQIQSNFQRARMNLISSITEPEIEPTMPLIHWISCWSSFNIPFIVFSSCLNSPEWSCFEFSFVFHKRYLLLCLHRFISYLQTFMVWVRCVESTYLCKNLLYLRTPIDWFLSLFHTNQNCNFSSEGNRILLSHLSIPPISCLGSTICV